MTSISNPRLALDTNAYRALREGNSTLARAFRSSTDLGLPVVTLGELYFGIYNGARTDEELQKLNKFLASPRLTILDMTTETARLFGEISTQLRRAGKPIQQNDVWIAALCKQYGFTLATADQGFDHVIGLELLHF